MIVSVPLMKKRMKMYLVNAVMCVDPILPLANPIVRKVQLV